ncbi:MAG: hypothetical protein WCB04_09145 [Mycobacteriales bacterium]
MSARWPDDEPTGLPPEWAGFAVPDDISELDAEVRAVRREVYGRSRWTGLGPRRGSLRRRRLETSGIVLLGALILTLFVASLGVFLLPTRQPGSQAQPLSDVTADPGVAEALVPDVALTVGRNGSLRLRSVRPAVLVVLPSTCACEALLKDVIEATRAGQLRVVVIGRTRDPVLPSTVPRSRVTAATDAGGRIAATYQSGLTPMVLFVRANGVVARVMNNPSPGSELHDEANALAR